MKAWEHETIRDAAAGTIAGQLCDWPEVAEALANNGLPLPGLMRMNVVREICRLMLAEPKTSDSSGGNMAESVANEWICGNRDYPGDIIIIAAMDEYMHDHARQRQHGTDVLASARLDDAERLIAKIRSYFNL